MIDLHAHILPGLDDGARDIEESLEMCRVAARDGIKAIVATPHTGNGAFDNPREKVLNAVAELNARIREEAIDIEIVPGADVYVHEQLDVLINERQVMTVNDNMRYVMIEFPKHIIPPNHIEWMFRLTLAGLTPILTHPERNTAIHQRLDIVREWIEKGGLVQLTAMSITGAFGKSVQKCSEELLKNNLVHVIASDAHSAGRRPPVLSRAVDRAASLIGAKQVHKLIDDYPAAIVAGKVFYAPEPVPPKSGFFSRFFARHQ